MKHSFKKRCMVIATAVLMVIPGTTVFAKGRDVLRNDRSCQNVCTFADADKDGLCDHCNREDCPEKGCSFIDTDKDGICDHCNREDCRKQQTAPESQPTPGCHGQGHGSGRGRGCRRG